MVFRRTFKTIRSFIVLGSFCCQLSRVSAQEIKIDDSVPSDIAQTMRRDLKNLRKSNLVDNDPETRRIMGLDVLNANSFNQWLEDRSVYMVGEKFNLETQVYAASSSWSFENPGELPEMDPGKKVAPGGKVQTVMTNLGPALYFAGKLNNTLIGLRLTNGDTISMTSPRLGSFQIGQGLFSGKETIDPAKPDALSNSLSRLAVYFHEARHSDGHGKSLGFFHAICPKGHPFEGYNACDANRNGPYTVGAKAMYTFIKSCTECSVAEKEAMKLIAIDSENRVLKTKAASHSGVDVGSPEIIQTLLDTYKLLAQFETDPAKLADLKKKIAELEAEIAGLTGTSDSQDTPTTDWDAAPEGQR